MIYSYCNRCKLETPGDVCAGCGKRAAAGSQRDIWSITCLPLADGRIWLASLLALTGAAVLLLITVFAAEAILGNASRAALLWNSSVPRLALAAVPLGLAAVFLFLLLQGKEVEVYILDKNGAHLQTWHEPHKLKSWARLQSADPQKNIQQQDGTVMHLAQERHINWRDVVDVQYKPRHSAIHLYHTPHCAPLVLRLPDGEYNTAAAYVGKYCKKKK